MARKWDGGVVDPERFENMSEKEATKEYMQTLKEVYKERGPLAAMGYELKSAGYSIGKRLGILVDQGVVAGSGKEYSNLKHDDWRRGTRGYGNYVRAKENVKVSTTLRKAFILRDSKKSNGLEAATITASILGLVGGAFFLSANMTGNVIADYSTQTTSFIGVLLFVIAIIAGVLWLSLKKKKVVKKVSKKKK